MTVGAQPTYAGLADEALPELIGRGDVDALGELYDRYGQHAYALVLRMVADRHAAEDVVERLFLRVWRGERTLAGRESVRSWLIACAHREAETTLRRDSRRLASARELVDLVRYGRLTLRELADHFGASRDEIVDRLGTARREER